MCFVYNYFLFFQSVPIGVQHPVSPNLKLGGGKGTRLCIVICAYVFPYTVDDGAKPKAH